MAEAVFRSLTHHLPRTNRDPTSPTTTEPPPPPHPLITTISSAGTAAYHTHAPPDSRTLHTLTAHSITSYTHRARKVRAQDFDDYDYILGMDWENVRDLVAMKGRVDRDREGTGKGKGKKKKEKSKAEVRLFGEFGERDEVGRGKGEVVVDPYYGADDGFEVCFEQVERFGRAFLREVLGEGWEGMGG